MHKKCLGNVEKDIVLKKNILESKIKKISEGKFQVVASNQSMDRDNEIVDTYSLKVPKVDGETRIPMLIDHEHSITKQVGVSRNVYVNEQGELIADVELADGIPLAENVKRLAELDMLGNSVSIGFIPDYSQNEGNKFVGAELIEISFVTVGANPDARVLTSKKLSDEQLTAMFAHERKNMSNENIEKQEDTSTTETAENSTVSVEELKAQIDELKELVASQATAKSEETSEQADDVEDKEEETSEDDEIKKLADEVKKLKEEKEKLSKGLSKIGKVGMQKNIVKVSESVEKATVKQIRALAMGDRATAGMYSNVHAKLQGYANTLGNELVLHPEVLNTIERCSNEESYLRSLVSTVTLTDSNALKYTTQTSNFDFAPIGECTTKPTQDVKFENKEVKISEWALINVHCDDWADDIAINWYNEFVNQIGGAKARLDDNIILNWDGVRTGATDLDPTGILAMAGVAGVSGVDFTDPDAIIDALQNQACNQCACNDGGTYVMNQCTWSKIKGARSGADGHFLFGTASEIATMNTLWGSPTVIVPNNVMANDTVIYGDFSKYKLLQKGSVEIVASNTAVVGGQSMFENDKTAIRAKIRAGGYTAFPDCFFKITA